MLQMTCVKYDPMQYNISKDHCTSFYAAQFVDHWLVRIDWVL